jgi:SAM-dependent methyltransferase
MGSALARRRQGTVFGRDPAAYDRARLPYPPRLYRILSTRCGLRTGVRVFEVGPGTGLVTRELLRRGAAGITVVEPDRRLARYLLRSLGPGRAKVRPILGRFEETSLEAAGYDLGVAGASFHWTSERRALRRVARALRPGGWWASWNNHYRDPYRASPFHRRLQPIYRQLYPGRADDVYDRHASARERRRRLGALRATGQFERIHREDLHWTATLDTARVRALWGSFSDVMILPARRREWLLRELARVVEEEYGGRVRVPMLVPLYTARRR